MPLHAQQPAGQPPANGWSSAWTEPLTPREKSLRQLGTELTAAKKSGDFAAVQAKYERLVRDHPDDLAAAEALFDVHWARKLPGASLADLDHIAEISKKSQAPGRRFAVIAYDRSIIHQEQHDYTAEASDLEGALQHDQTFHPVLNSLAWLRATNPNPALQNGDEAVHLANLAVQRAGRHFYDLDTLAAAYAAQGKYSRAVSLEKEAIALLNQEVNDPKKAAETLQRASARLDLYTHDQPDRETDPK